MAAGDIDDAVQGARLVNFLPYLHEEIDKLQGNVYSRVQVSMDAGEFTPELAYQLWMEWISYQRLMKRLDTKGRMAITAGQKARKHL